MAARPLPVLIAEDDPGLREALVDTLRLAGYEVVEAVDGESALRHLEKTSVGIVVSDVQMKPMDGHRLLAEIKRRHPHLPVLLMTAYGMIDRAVDAIRAGAADYITKPFEPEALTRAVVRHMLPAVWGDGELMVAEDAATRQVMALVQRVAGSDATVLITGESGTGKEVLARAVHRLSPRAAGPFVAINCAAIPDNLLESVLFGHEKGAFTGAQATMPGKFEQADGGTLLLDEISEMPLSLQAKLLRALQEREVERVGGRRPIAVDIRVVATSNRDMAAEVAAGRFREDLFYRLNVFPLHNPPLRQRPGDVLAIARRALARGLKPGARPAKTLSPEAEAALTGYGWPGNIRELENVLQRAMILAPGAVIEPEHLGLPATGGAVRNGLSGAAPSGLAAAGLPDLKSLERQHILDALQAVRGVRKLAAERLGMSERTLRYKLRQYREEGFKVQGSGSEE
ncbi:MAG: sigma-54-dependent Fis family transcriptional regulator [Rhodocyclaceae bacterium]|jgi:two-component system response regulator FlrC|nr:sigma-54-dependent Fis family transcriptional regulator [Rhodocyclaceae bacterium]MCA3133046.1 sigma-54-dependent Fis family transcriptional regulator [Rhodocyclaceae bacterium]MCA3144783.1 sigma-54-dependent Fis family transcriptional regulator [Rhodocyclaceae bacterium]